MVLGIDQTATAEVINRSYRQLALKHHPDRNAGRDTTAAFQLLGRAYETLKDESKRRAYDLLYPSIRRSHTNPQTSRAPSTSESQPEIPSEASQISKLVKSKLDRQARWWPQRAMFESAISQLKKDIHDLKQQIRNLESIAAAEKEEEAWDQSWSAWLLSPIYNKAQTSEDEKARIDRERQERRIEKDMKERRLHAKISEFEKQKALLKDRQAEINKAGKVDDQHIKVLQDKILYRQALAREAKERAQREEAAKLRKREQEEREKRQREAAEESARKWKQQQEEWERRNRELAEQVRIRQAAAGRRRVDAFDDDDSRGFSTVGLCVHDGWWAKVQGRTRCPLCSDVWSYLLECPGCDMRACPKCQAIIRPRYTRRRG
ncbi:DnaJ domain-containing protein [Astrocystis sublimbata]|nr:DnaJ domain-containing protein [Astrocystis sublimbata]